MSRIYKAIILNEPFAGKVKNGTKPIETRMKRFSHRGDLIICCDKGKSKDSPNAGKALCIVDVWKVRTMRDSDEQAACIENVHGRYAYLLRNWRHFNRDFNFTSYAITKNWQGIFEIELPEDVVIIPRPDIIPFREYLSPQEAYALLKEDTEYDYLNFDQNPETGKWEVWIGNRKNPIEIFDDHDSAQTLVANTHKIINNIRSARQLRSLFQ